MAKKMKSDTPESPLSAVNPVNSGSNAQQPGSETSVAGQVSGMVDSAKQAATHVLDQAKDQATSHANQQRQTLASGIQAVAESFHSLGDELRKKEQGPVANYAAEMGHAIGGQVEQFGNYLRDRDVHQLITDTEDFARRSPTIFLGSAFLLGLAASRFLKSSRPASAIPLPEASNPGPSVPVAPLALLPASTSPSEVDSTLPSGFPFTPMPAPGAPGS